MIYNKDEENDNDGAKNYDMGIHKAHTQTK
jgi:hypothetical protein